MLGYEDDSLSSFAEWMKLVHPDDIASQMQQFEAHLNHQMPYYVADPRPPRPKVFVVVLQPLPRQGLGRFVESYATPLRL